MGGGKAQPNQRDDVNSRGHLVCACVPRACSSTFQGQACSRFMPRRWKLLLLEADCQVCAVCPRFGAAAAAAHAISGEIRACLARRVAACLTATLATLTIRLMPDVG